PHVLGISCKLRQPLAAFLGAELGHFCPSELDVGAGRELGEVELEVRGIVAVLDFVPELLLRLARFLDELALAHARERLGELARAGSGARAPWRAPWRRRDRSPAGSA